MTRPSAALLALVMALAACQGSPSGGSSGEPAASGISGGFETVAPSSSGPSDGSPAAAPSQGPVPTLAPPPPATGVNCSSGSLSPNQFATLRKAVPNVRSNVGLCIVDFALYFPDEGVGSAVVTASGAAILVIDMTNYYGLGTAGSTYADRIVTPSAPIALVSGTTLSLSFAGCTGCDTLTVTVEAASR